MIAVSSGSAVCEIARLALETRRYGGWGLYDDTLDTIPAEFRKFSDNEIIPLAQDVHRLDVLIPMLVIVASRLLVDARVPSIFEGANEIQAHVIRAASSGRGGRRHSGGRRFGGGRHRARQGRRRGSAGSDGLFDLERQGAAVDLALFGRERSR